MAGTSRRSKMVSGSRSSASRRWWRRRHGAAVAAQRAAAARALWRKRVARERGEAAGPGGGESPMFGVGN
jgi:RNA-splicing ligase RtcB